MTEWYPGVEKGKIWFCRLTRIGNRFILVFWSCKMKTGKAISFSPRGNCEDIELIKKNLGKIQRRRSQPAPVELKISVALPFYASPPLSAYGLVSLRCVNNLDFYQHY